jgi:hypothetical protein
MSANFCGDAAWVVHFIQPSHPGDNRCVMLYGRFGEIVGPLTMDLAEAWMDEFDNSRYARLLQAHLAESL